VSDEKYQTSGKIFSLCYFFDNMKRYLLVDFSLCRKDTQNNQKDDKKTFFLNCFFDKTKRHFINIFLSCRKDKLKMISFYHLLDIFSICSRRQHFVIFQYFVLSRRLCILRSYFFILLLVSFKFI